MDTSLINDTIGKCCPSKYLQLVKFIIFGLGLIACISSVLIPICTTILNEYPSCQISYGVIVVIIILGIITTAIYICTRKVEEISAPDEPDRNLLAVNTPASTSTGNAVGVKLKAKNRLVAKFDKVNAQGNRQDVTGVIIEADDDANVGANIINCM